MILKIPPLTHNYLIESLSNCFHVKVMLAARFIQFHESLQNNKKSIVRFLCSMCINNRRTIHGRNFFKLQRHLNCKPEELSNYFIKDNMKYKPLPDEEQWRVPLILNLLEIRNKTMSLDAFDSKEINKTIEQTCIN